MKEYFMITSGESGLDINGPFTEAEVLRRIKDYYDDPTFVAILPDCDDGHWINTPARSVAIIQGNIVIPKVVEKVTEYRLS